MAKKKTAVTPMLPIDAEVFGPNSFVLQRETPTGRVSYLTKKGFYGLRNPLQIRQLSRSECWESHLLNDTVQVFESPENTYRFADLEELTRHCGKKDRVYVMQLHFTRENIINSSFK